MAGNREIQTQSQTQELEAADFLLVRRCYWPDLSLELQDWLKPGEESVLAPSVAW
jgi:hypothetical protein